MITGRVDNLSPGSVAKATFAFAHGYPGGTGPAAEPGTTAIEVPFQYERALVDFRPRLCRELRCRHAARTDLDPVVRKT